MKYKQIVFDVDGTLIDTEYAVLHSLQDTIMNITKKKVKIEELTFALGITGRDALTEFDIEDIELALNMWDKNIVIRQIKRCPFRQIKTGLFECLIMV